MSVYNQTPNRVDDYRVRNAMETIANYVSLMPEMNVGFDAEFLTLSTQKYGMVNDPHTAAEFEIEMDTIAKNIENHLKDEGFSKVTISPAETGDLKNDLAGSGHFDMTAMGWGSGVGIGSTGGRQLLYTVKATYEYTAEA
jgi:hypothetical protein